MTETSKQKTVTYRELPFGARQWGAFAEYLRELHTERGAKMRFY